MKDKAIILDLDDTLISTHYRQYCCINDFLTTNGKSFISFGDYIQQRRLHNLSNINLLKVLNIDLDWKSFNAIYLENIESKRYLTLDELIVEKAFLALAVQQGFKLVLLSLRNNPANSENQLQNLGIAGFFNEIIFEKHNDAQNPKIFHLKQLSNQFNIVAFCGDSKPDYDAAKQLNINFVQVKTSLYQLPDFETAKQFDSINGYFSSIL
jgi:phosphoglycolate phosphatase-like HAD superfamily hydrolase